jgi:5-hydroxyisourate hydrolase
MSQITTHVLDTATGKPARPVPVSLYREEENNWIQVGSGITNDNGRIMDLLDASVTLPPGLYKLKFETAVYFKHHNTTSFYPYIEVPFLVRDDAHYHIPLLLSPFGYTTYRGS